MHFKTCLDDLVTGGPMNYILAYKFSQDHLELFNGSVRSSLGKNNNPTCRQFCWIFKRLLVKLELSDVKGSCVAQDSTSLLTVSSVSRKSIAEIKLEDIILGNHDKDDSDIQILESANLVITFLLL